MQYRLPQFDALGRLSAREATEFAARIAELTKAGLPLGDGLRAMAAELPGRRLRRLLHALADRLDAGEDLPGALQQAGASLPSHLRGLILAGLHSGRVAEVLEEYVALQNSQSELRRRVAMTLAYPFFLLLLIAAIVVVANYWIVDEFAKLFRDFGVRLPDITLLIINGSKPLTYIFVTLVGLSAAIPVLLWLVPKASWVWPPLYQLPIVGPLLRWSHLTQFARLMGLLLQQQVALPDALRVTAAGLCDTRLAEGCRRAADDLETGVSLDTSLATKRPFPPSLIPIIQWGLRTPALADAFDAAAELFDGRMRCQSRLLETILLPLIFLIILLFAGVFVVAMFLPMISLISCLSGS